MPGMNKRSLKEDKKECMQKKKKRGGGVCVKGESQKLYSNAEGKPQIQQVAEKKHHKPI